MNLEDTTKTISEKCISIPVKSNGGRKGYLITSNAGTYLSMPGSKYWDDDGYLHIDEKRLETEYPDGQDLPSSNPTTEAEVRAVICKINTLYFAGTLKVASDFFQLRSHNERIGILSPREMFRSLFVRKKFFSFLCGGRKKWHDYRISFRHFRFFKYRSIDVAVYMDCPPLGGTWQGYYPEGSNWLQEAADIKGSRIYLA